MKKILCFAGVVAFGYILVCNLVKQRSILVKGQSSTSTDSQIKSWFFEGIHHTIVREREPTIIRKDNVVEIDYGPFAMSVPHFIRPVHREFWMNYSTWLIDRSQSWGYLWIGDPIKKMQPNLDNFTRAQLSRKDEEMWVYYQNEYTRGIVTLYNDTNTYIPPGTWDFPGFCQAELADAHKARTSQATRGTTYEKMIWLVHLWGDSFQHVTFDVIPKIAQLLLAYPSINFSEWALLVAYNPAAVYLDYIFKYLNFTQIVAGSHVGTVYNTRNLLFGCHAPQRNPNLGQLAKQLYKVNTNIPQTRILLFSRSVAKGGSGRRACLNDASLFESIRQWVQKSKLNYTVEWANDYQFGSNIPGLVNFWSSVKVLIGPHGGGITNHHFMQANSTIIEMMAVRSPNKKGSSVEGTVYWWTSTQSGQDYWYWFSIDDPANIISPGGDGNGNFNVNIPDIIGILSKRLLH
jgi:hypothetical protein